MKIIFWILILVFIATGVTVNRLAAPREWYETTGTSTPLMKFIVIGMIAVFVVLFIVFEYKDKRRK